MGNKEEKKNKQNEFIITNFLRDTDVTLVLAKFKLRMFYTNGVHLGRQVDDFTKVISSYVDCEIRYNKSGKPEYISAEAEDFSLIIYIKKKDFNQYTYSSISYYDKINNKSHEIYNPNYEENNIGNKIFKVLSIKRKK